MAFFSPGAADSAPLSRGKSWLRLEADIRTGAGGGNARFSHSSDGSGFTELGDTFGMKVDWPYFLGYRFALFNYATQSLGGSVEVLRFELESP